MTPPRDGSCSNCHGHGCSQCIGTGKAEDNPRDWGWDYDAIGNESGMDDEREDDEPYLTAEEEGEEYTRAGHDSNPAEVAF